MFPVGHARGVVRSPDSVAQSAAVMYRGEDIGVQAADFASDLTGGELPESCGISGFAERKLWFGGLDSGLLELGQIAWVLGVLSIFI